MSNIYTNTSMEIKARLDIVDLINEHVSLARRGRNYWGLCLFHSEKTPSFSVNPEKQMFYCFGCKEAGDVFTFLMKLYKIDFKSAHNLLAARTGLQTGGFSHDAMQRLVVERKRRDEEKNLVIKLQSLIDDEYRRLIGLERWMYIILKSVKNQYDLERLEVVWALKNKDIVNYCLDALIEEEEAEKLAVIKYSRMVVGP